VDKELTETDSLLSKTDTVLNKITTVETETSGIPILTATISTIQKQLFNAREQHDPEAISTLQKELSDVEAAKLQLSRQILNSAAHSLLALQTLFTNWTSAREHTKDESELRNAEGTMRYAAIETLYNARALAKQLLSLLPATTQDDALADAEFYTMLRNGASPEGIKQSADYMSALIKRVIAANPRLGR
jgi:hypothetical protein